jgi:addiction module HigA family antidote
MSKLIPLPHPGETIREDILESLGMSVNQLAKTAARLNEIGHVRRGITADTALRLALSWKLPRVLAEFANRLRTACGAGDSQDARTPAGDPGGSGRSGEGRLVRMESGASTKPYSRAFHEAL